MFLWLLSSVVVLMMSQLSIKSFKTIEFLTSLRSVHVSWFCCRRSGTRDPEADFKAQTGAEEPADAARDGAAAGRRARCPALRPPVRGAPRAAAEGEGGAAAEGAGASQTPVSGRAHTEHSCMSTNHQLRCLCSVPVFKSEIHPVCD